MNVIWPIAPFMVENLRGKQPNNGFYLGRAFNSIGVNAAALTLRGFEINAILFMTHMKGYGD